MTRSEALTFLELPENADEKAIRQRLKEKLEYYEKLSQQAPSDFLKKLNTQHLAKVKNIHQEIFTFNLSEPGNVVDLSGTDDLVLDIDDNQPLTTPIIISRGSKAALRQNKTQAAAWLIRHTENQSHKSYPLVFGKNHIGRKVQQGIEHFVEIDGDPFISKRHAMIYVEESEGTVFIADNDTVNGGNKSRNGTFINGNQERIDGKVQLKDNDTIQVGETKLVLRLNTEKIEKIIEEVEKRKFMHTVVVRDNNL